MTNGGMLSQEEIDALLNDETPEQAPNMGSSEASDTLESYLSPIEKDAMGEIGNIAFGSAATALSTLLNQKVDITTPELSLVSKHNLSTEFPIPYVSVFVTFTDGFEGSNVLMIKTSDAKIIADLMLGGDGTNPSEAIDEIHLSAVQEAMNQMMGSSATSMSTIFSKRVDISPPSIELMDVRKAQGTERLPDEDMMLKVSFDLKVGNLIDSNIMQLIPIPFAKQLVQMLLEPEELNEPPQKRQVEEPKKSKPPQERKEHQVAEYQRDYKEKRQLQQDIQPVSFSEFDGESELKTGSQNLSLLMDIPLKVTVELGRTQRTVKDILDLAPGSIVELDKLAGEPVDILINQKPIAKGEVVVIDENFGVRVTEILSQKERLRKLN